MALLVGLPVLLATTAHQATAARGAATGQTSVGSIPFVALRYHGASSDTQTDGRYLFTPRGQVDAPTVLLDSQTGHTLTVPAAPDTGCVAVLLGGGHLVDTCGSAGDDDNDGRVWVYSLAQNRWAALPGGDHQESPGQVGRYWLELAYQGEDGGVDYINLATGKDAGASEDDNEYVDLDRPTFGYGPRCKGLSDAAFQGWLAPEEIGVMDDLAGDLSQDTLYLQRCGSRPRTVLAEMTMGEVASWPYVIWADPRTARYLDGYDAATHRFFRFAYPPRTDCTDWSPLFIVGRRVYMTGSDRSWYATLPPSV